MIKQKNRTAIDVINYIIETVMSMFADHIVEQGVSGIWRYEKWASGTLKLYGRYTNSALTFSGTWGAMYTGKINDRLEYPVAFVEPPHEVVQAHGKEISMFWYPNSSGYGVPTETHSASYIAARPTAAGSTYTVYLDIFAEGRWK